MKKIIAGFMATAVVLTSNYMISSKIFANNFDCKIEISKPIKQYPSWCWETSTQMLLRNYLETEGKLGQDEFLFEKYGQECIDIANKYLNTQKSLDEFDKFCDNTILGLSGDRGLYNEIGYDKEAVFLAYLGTVIDLSSDNQNEIFITQTMSTINIVVDIVLKAVGLNDKMGYRIELVSDLSIYRNNRQDYQTLLSKYDMAQGLIYYIVNYLKCPVISGNGWHYKIINGNSSANEIWVQETAGNQASEQSIDLLYGEYEWFFIGDRNFSENTAIWFPTKNEVLEENDEIYVAVFNNNNGVILNGFEKLNFECVCSDDMLNKTYQNYYLQVNFTYPKDTKEIKYLENSSEFRWDAGESYPFYLYKANVPKEYAGKTIEDFRLAEIRSLNNLSVNTEGSSGSEGFISSSGSGGSSGSSGSGGSSGSSGSGVSSGSSGSSNTTNTSQSSNTINSDNSHVLVKYDYTSVDKPISAEKSISMALEKNKNINSLADIGSNDNLIVFETNKYNQSGSKENLAVWTMDLKKLNKEFLANYEEKQKLESKGTLNEMEKQRLKEVTDKISEFNFKLKVNVAQIDQYEMLTNQAKEVLKSQNAIIVDFLENGIFPGTMTVDLNLGKDKADQKYIVYYMLPTEVNHEKVTQLISKEIVVNNEGYVRFVADRGADYIFIPATEYNLSNLDNITDLLK